MREQQVFIKSWFGENRVLLTYSTRWKEREPPVSQSCILIVDSEILLLGEVVENTKTIGLSRVPLHPSTYFTNCTKVSRVHVLVHTSCVRGKPGVATPVPLYQLSAESNTPKVLMLYRGIYIEYSIYSTDDFTHLQKQFQNIY